MPRSEDLLTLIDERLAPNHQVIYTTHSPFMVEPAVSKEHASSRTRGRTKARKSLTEVFATDRDSLFPLQAALGYDIAQNLFVGPDNLLVEGTSRFHVPDGPSATTSK